MSFKKNKENINKNGRPKGSKNEKTKAINEFVKNLIENSKEQIQIDFNGLEPQQRIKFFIDLLKYVLPIQKSVEHTEIDIKPIFTRRLSTNKKE